MRNLRGCVGRRPVVPDCNIIELPAVSYLEHGKNEVRSHIENKK